MLRQQRRLRSAVTLVRVMRVMRVVGVVGVVQWMMKRTTLHHHHHHCHHHHRHHHLAHRLDQAAAALARRWVLPRAFTLTGFWVVPLVQPHPSVAPTSAQSSARGGSRVPLQTRR